MNAITDIAVQEAEPLDEFVEAAQARLRALARLTEIGMSLAELVHARAMAQVEAEASGEVAARSGPKSVERIDFGQAFAKIARGVRLTISLEEKLEKALRDRKAGLETARRAWALKTAENEAARAEAEEKAASEAAWQEAYGPRLAREKVVREVMEELNHRQNRDDEDEIDRLDAEVEERLEQEYGDYEDFGERPVSETVRRLCEEFGLDPDWERWREEDWAIQEAEAGVEGSPFVRAAAGGTDSS